MIQAFKNGRVATRPARSIVMKQSTDPRGHANASEVERGAYNRAFSELGLEWYWDAGTYDRLKTCAGDKDCVQAYVERDCPHLLQAYDSGFLAAAVETVRRRLSEGEPH
jgi:hypothetical protein